MKARGLFSIVCLVLAAALLLTACTPADDAQPTSSPGVSGQGDSGSGQPTSAPSATATPQPTTEPADSQASDFEEVSGYRAEMVTEITDGDESFSSTTEFAYLADPLAWSMKSTMADGTETETRFVDGTMYTFVEGEWMAITLGEDEAEDYVDIMSAEDWSETFDDECEDLGNETINGFKTRHYRCDAAVMESIMAAGSALDDEDDSVIESGVYDVWVSDKYGVAIKVAMDIVYQEADGTTTSWMYTQTILEISDDIVIEAPDPDDISSTMDMSGEIPEDYPFPIMEGATDFFDMMGMTGYTVEASMVTVGEFYVDAMAADGWTLDEDNSMTDASMGMLSYTWTQGGQTVNVMITADEAQVSVMIMAE